VSIFKKVDDAAQRRIDRALGTPKPQPKDEVAERRDKRQQKGGKR